MILFSDFFLNNSSSNSYTKWKLHIYYKDKILDKIEKNYKF